MWNVQIELTGQQNLEGKIDQSDEVYITVQPGLWTHAFLNKAGCFAKKALYQFGYLAQDILKIDAYHDELALRLALHLTMESRFSREWHLQSGDPSESAPTPNGN